MTHREPLKFRKSTTKRHPPINLNMAFLAEPDDEGDNELDPAPCITGSTR